jgi:hypothetical protein
MDEGNYTANSDKEWDERVLCSDESCIGVIGPDGRCKECGLEYKGPSPVSSEPERSEDLADNGDETEIDENFKAAAEEDQEWAQRKLCSDGNCIGVIGPDGRCKECGRPYES